MWLILLTSILLRIVDETNSFQPVTDYLGRSELPVPWVHTSAVSKPQHHILLRLLSHHPKRSPWLTVRRVDHTSKIIESNSVEDQPNKGDVVVVDDDDTVQTKNRAYCNGLLENLHGALDKWMMNGSPDVKQRAHNVYQLIQRESLDPEITAKARRLVQRAGLTVPASSMTETSSTKITAKKPSAAPSAVNVKDDVPQRAEQRRQWEDFRNRQATESKEDTDSTGARSAISQRQLERNGKQSDLFPSEVGRRLDVQTVAQDKIALENQMKAGSTQEWTPSQSMSSPSLLGSTLDESAAITKVSRYIATAGAGNAFTSQVTGIGGLDDVLAQVRRRVWIPLAAPPQVLTELGIHPIRGLLLYGKPGCGKTLLARTLGAILSPLRPITIVSGPEIMDKFVGSSEKNLREIFDNPPDIYDTYRLGETDNGVALAKAALHVIVMDEFDAIARARGGRGGDQGDAGVARDSVVNQLLAKMDGVDPLAVPTLVIGLTNKRSLIEPALLRPGRFEVQIEVPPPRTVEQRVSILEVHTRRMQASGRLLVRDAPVGTVAAQMINNTSQLFSYEELLHDLAIKMEGCSGASLAAVARAAASHALERTVESFAANTNTCRSILEDCVVTAEDFSYAVADVFESTGSSDWSQDETETKDMIPT